MLFGIAVTSRIVNNSLLYKGGAWAFSDISDIPGENQAW